MISPKSLAGGNNKTANMRKRRKQRVFWDRRHLEATCYCAPFNEVPPTVRASTWPHPRSSVRSAVSCSSELFRLRSWPGLLLSLSLFFPTDRARAAENEKPTNQVS